MIDTVVLNLTRNEFTLLPWCEFKFLEQTNNAQEQVFSKFILNPTTQDKRRGRYMPRLTKLVRGQDEFLRVEFSASKLVFGNNFDELVDSDFNRVLQALIETLKAKGIALCAHQVARVEPSAIHFAKNTALTNYVSCSMIINELYKADWNKRLDVSKIKFGNTGESLQIHTNSFELVFYDKIKDLQQARISEKRAIEKDNVWQIGLFHNQPKNKPLDVLRMEVRLGTKKKIRHTLGQLGFDQDLSFKGLFKQTISKAVLQFFWQDARAGMDLLAIDSSDTERLLQDLLRRNPKLQLGKALALSTVATIINQTAGGIRQYRQTTDHYTNTSSWQKYKRELKKLKLPIKAKYQSILELENALEKFFPLKLIDIERRVV